MRVINLIWKTEQKGKKGANDALIGTRIYTCALLFYTTILFLANRRGKKGDERNQWQLDGNIRSQSPQEEKESVFIHHQ